MDLDAQSVLKLVAARCLCQCHAAFESCVAARREGDETKLPKGVRETLLLVPSQVAGRDTQVEGTQHSQTPSTSGAVTSCLVVNGGECRDDSDECRRDFSEMELTGLALEALETRQPQAASMQSLLHNRDTLLAHVSHVDGVLCTESSQCLCTPVLSSKSKDVTTLLVVEILDTGDDSQPLTELCSQLAPASATVHALLEVTVSKVVETRRLANEAQLWKAVQSINGKCDAECANHLCSSCLDLLHCDGVALVANRSHKAGILPQLVATAVSSTVRRDQRIALSKLLNDHPVSSGQASHTVATVDDGVVSDEEATLSLRLVKLSGTGFSRRQLSNARQLLANSADTIARSQAANQLVAVRPEFSDSLVEIGKALQSCIQECKGDAVSHQRIVRTAVEHSRSDCGFLFFEKRGALPAVRELVARAIVTSEEEERKAVAQLKLSVTEGFVAATLKSGASLNISRPAESQHYCPQVDDYHGTPFRSILCLPVHDEKGVAGVLQLCRKSEGSGAYTPSQVEASRMCAMYCGLATSQESLYSNLLEAENRSSLFTELMMYHMQVSEVDVHTLVQQDAWCVSELEVKYDFDTFTFTGLELSERDTVKAILAIYEDMGLCTRWRIPRDKLCRFLLTVQRGYRDTPYHNWRHAVSVCQFCYYLWRRTDHLKPLRDIELLALLVSALCHDIDHRGTNNNFQEKAGSVFASLYMSEGSVMERHHFAQTMCILSSRPCNILSELSDEEYRTVTDMIYEIILDTDLYRHLTLRKGPIESMAQSGIEQDNSEHRMLVMSLAISASDLNSSSKNWIDAQHYAEKLYAEFFNQGEMERLLVKQLPTMSMMNRDEAIIPKEQIGFMNGIARPVFKLLADVFPVTGEVYEQVDSNLENWKRIEREFWREPTGTEDVELLTETIHGCNVEEEEWEDLEVEDDEEEFHGVLQKETDGNDNVEQEEISTEQPPPPPQQKQQQQKQQQQQQQWQEPAATTPSPTQSPAVSPLICPLASPLVSGKSKTSPNPPSPLMRTARKHAILTARHPLASSALRATAKHSSPARFMTVASNNGGGGGRVGRLHVSEMRVSPPSRASSSQLLLNRKRMSLPGSRSTSTPLQPYASGPDGMPVLLSNVNRKCSLNIGASELLDMWKNQGPVGQRAARSAHLGLQRPSQAASARDLPATRLDDNLSLHQSLVDRQHSINSAAMVIAPAELIGAHRAPQVVGAPARRDATVRREATVLARPGNSESSVGSGHVIDGLSQQDDITRSSSTSSVDSSSTSGSSGTGTYSEDEDQGLPSSDIVTELPGRPSSGTGGPPQRRLRKDGSVQAFGQELPVFNIPCEQRGDLRQVAGQASRSDPGPRPNVIFDQEPRRPSEPVHGRVVRRHLAPDLDGVTTVSSRQPTSEGDLSK